MTWLLEGPRGRRLLWELAAGADDRRLVTDDVRAVLSQGVPPGTWTEDEVLRAFADSVSWARYWQEPDEIDIALTDLGDLLLPLAHQVPVPQWWDSPVALEDQVIVVWEGTAPTLIGSTDKLQTWYDDTTADERRAASERPEEVTANWSGRWWSTPTMSGLPVTSRPGAGLALVEDDLGWTSAQLLPVSVTTPVRVCEVHAPSDWVELVRRYPLEVSASRRHDWWRATGAREPLLMPDFRAAAKDWDGIHVSARGYLTTATRALPVDGGTTVLAGWSPDQTWWLSDCLRPNGPPVRRTGLR